MTWQGAFPPFAPLNDAKNAGIDRDDVGRQILIVILLAFAKWGFESCYPSQPVRSPDAPSKLSRKTRHSGPF